MWFCFLWLMVLAADVLGEGVCYPVDTRQEDNVCEPRAGRVGEAEVICSRSCFPSRLRPSRSHPTILDIPNQLYYERELQPCANLVDRERFCQWEGLPRKVRGSHPIPSC